ncbi:MAG TPA: P-II family nitrogen regulator, partial [Acidimicrobiales bacterium]|nr:P-II family nitrogen regulator [Acidimicrobiales bacterium]
MKLLTLVVKPYLLAEVVAAAMEAGAGGATVTEVRGFGRQGGHSESYRGAEYLIELVPKSCIQVVVPDDKVDD